MVSFCFLRLVKKLSIGPSSKTNIWTANQADKRISPDFLFFVVVQSVTLGSMIRVLAVSDERDVTSIDCPIVIEVCVS
jgi:hypothetical protein